MLLLSPTQLSQSTDPALTFLGQVMATGPGPEYTIRTDEHGSRNGVGNWIRRLTEMGVLAVDGDGYSRQSYTIRIVPAEFASWYEASQASARWPNLVPDVYNQLRGEFSALPENEFDSRLRESLLEALTRSDRVNSIIPWMRGALSRPRRVPATATTSEPEPPSPEQKARGRRALSRLFGADYDYLTSGPLPSPPREARGSNTPCHPPSPSHPSMK